MARERYLRKPTLNVIEVSDINISLRESIKRAKVSLKQANPDDLEGINEYIRRIQKLQKRFQRLALKNESDVLEDLRESRK